MKYCLEDRYTAQNIDCGYGTCINDTLSYDCNCDEGTIYETTDIGPTISDYIPMCIENTCKSDSDCQIYVIEDGYKQWSEICSIEKRKCIPSWKDK